MKSQIAKPLLRWYHARKRSLPWRERPEPYAVWVAEIMAQQTRLETMLPYYQRWMRMFPSVQALAAAREQQVLNAWEGLGYYSRARNLHKAARHLVAEASGRIPRSAAGLRQLPGIGAYTAGAIASLAFGEDVPAVDGNAVRVLSRLFDVEEPVHTAAGQQRLWALAAKHLPAGQAAEYNQAMMDLGATLCSPRPKCSECPLQAQCLANARGTQLLRPVKRRGAQLPVRHYAAALLWQGGKVLVLQRPARGLLAGMWEFPNVQVEQAGRAKTQLRSALLRELSVKVDAGGLHVELEHTYSHFQARLRVYDCGLVSNEITTDRPYKWLAPRSLSRLPMGKLDRGVADSLQGRHAG
ncbi:MAG: A/G-specific adenine glycosylase [Anaerolineales bacterium]|nr:MAG: A/G-specific adenine glycosylase [Anaerolineales bacterium]